jgi:hypothetical protein
MKSALKYQIKKKKIGNLSTIFNLCGPVLISGGVAELANEFVICPRDPRSNLGVDKIFSYYVCMGLNSNVYLYCSDTHLCIY